jgi:hypothetical protein
MLVRLTEVYEMPSVNKYGMREVSINPEHVVALRQDYTAKQALTEGRMPEGLSNQADFTRVYLNTGNLNVVVVGNSTIIEEKLHSVKRVLKG